MAVPSSFIMVICQSEKPYVSMPSARSFLAISLAPVRAASTFGKSSSCSVTTVVLFENSTLNAGMPERQRGRGHKVASIARCADYLMSAEGGATFASRNGGCQDECGISFCHQLLHLAKQVHKLRMRPATAWLGGAVLVGAGRRRGTDSG